MQGSGEYDYGADTIRVQDMLERRGHHNYYRYENEVDDYRQDPLQLLRFDQTMGDWELGGIVFSTLGAGYYEQFRQGDDLSDYGFSPIVTNVLDSAGSLLGADTVFTTDVVRRRWLDNTLLGSSWTVSTSTDHVDHVYGVSSSTYEGDHFGELIWMSADADFNPEMSTIAPWARSVI